MFQWKKTAESWERSKLAGGAWGRKEGINADNETNLIWQVMKKEDEDGGVPCPRQRVVVSTLSFPCIWTPYRSNTTPGCCEAGLGQKERAQMRTNLLEAKTHQWNERKRCREEQGVWKVAVGKDSVVARYSWAQRQGDGHRVPPQSVPCLCLHYTKGSRLCLWEMAATAPWLTGSMEESPGWVSSLSDTTLFWCLLVSELVICEPLEELQEWELLSTGIQILEPGTTSFKNFKQQTEVYHQLRQCTVIFLLLLAPCNGSLLTRCPAMLQPLPSLAPSPYLAPTSSSF